MSVRRRQNFLGQQRVDVPHLKSIESAVSNDFDELIQGLVIGENKSYVVRGLEINMPGSIGASASGLQLLVENSAILHGASNESGTFYTIPAGTLPEVLSSTTNDRVDGAFTPSTDNYVGLEFVRNVDDSTTDQVNFWNPTSNVEFSKTVPLAITLDYKIVISTSSFASNVLPIAIVQTDGSNNVISITDRRPLLYRLGVAGDQTPDPFYQYPWADGRVENFYTSTSSTANPFFGGDKQITTMKDFFDALMTEFKLLKGTPFWYSESAGSISRLRQDIANTAFTGKGNVIHGPFDFQGLVTGMTTNVIIKTISTSASGSITLTANGINNINTIIANHNSANPTSQVYLYSGNGAQVPSVNITLTSKPGQINWSDELYLSFIGGRLRYAVLQNEASDDILLSNNQVAYLELVRGVSIIPNLVFTQGGTVVTSVGSVNWTSDLQAGDFIKDASRGDEFYYEIASVNSLSQVTLKTPFLEMSSGPAGFDAQYAFGVYETSPAPSSERHVQIADRGSVPFGENYFWLFYRQDDTGAVPKVYARVLGGQELQQGEWQEISDNTSEAILQYIGSPSESDIDPDYTNALGVARTNVHLTDGENLTKSLKRLEQRDDIVSRVRVVDIVSTSLPTGASVTIDTEALNNDDYVMFTNSPIEGLYKVSGVGTSVAFEKLYAFGGSQQPVDGDLIRVEAGTEYFKTIWKRVGGYWKPLEVEDAVKEPTGFPNRTDSQISFDNGTRTFSIAPLAPATHFDVFAKGRVFRFESAQQITVPDVEGIYFFFFETNGTLNYSNVFDISIITQKIYVSNIYWDAANNQAIILADERHGVTLDGATHEYLHNLNGAVITSGGAINFTVGGTGNSDSDAQITIGNTILRDEDIKISIANSASPANPFEQILDPIAEIPVFYRDGASGDWRKDAATQYPVKQGTTRIQFNDPAGPWTQVDVQEGYYVSMWIFATNNISEPVIAILGQKEHALLSDAQAEDSYDSLSFGTMPVQEFKVLYRIIFQSSSAFTNAPNANLVDVRDLRAAEDTQFAQVAPNDHGLLSGLADPDHAPTAVTTVGVTKDGGLSASDTDLQQSLDTLNKLFGQLRIKEHPSDGKRVVITGADRILNNGQKLIQSLKNLVLSFDGAEINFETGDVYASDGITALGVNFTPATITASEYFNYSITVIPSSVNVDNTITAQLIVLPAANSSAVKASAPKAAFAKGIQLGQVTVQENAGGIQDITQADIMQLGTGGGSGTGTGDANSFTENLKHRLISSYYEFVTPVVFEIDEDNFENAATASFDIANGVYAFSGAAQYFESIQLFDAEFLANENDSRQIELHAEWFDSASRDDSALYQVALDGVNYENVTMTRQGLSQKFTGNKTLSVPPSISISSQGSGSTNTELDATSLQAISAPFIITDKAAVNNLTLEVNKLGSPTGSYIVSICEDSSGSPGDVLFSKIALISTLNSGLNALVFNTFRNVLVPGTYHIVIETDATYKSGFSTGVDALRVVTTASGGNDLVYNGVVWSAGTVDLKYVLSGHEYDLRVKVTSSAGSKKLKAFGVFYDEHVGDAIDGIDATQTFTFSGNLNTTSFLVTNFLPTQEKLKVYDIKTGQVYRYPAFNINGNTITFDSGTFLSPGETVQLIFDQSEGAAIASSVVVSGSGGGIGDVDTVLAQDFETATLASFTQTGLELVTTNQLRGTVSARLTHQAGSTRSFKQTFDVDSKFRGVNMTASLVIRSSASQGNVTIQFRDETNAVDYPAQQLQTNSQAIASLVTTSGSSTVSGFSNSIINTLKVGMFVTGSGISAGTRIVSINSVARTVTLSQGATASATVTLRFSDLPRTIQLGFQIPANCSSYSYTISALQEAGSPETYIDDIVLKNYWLGMSNQGQSSTSIEVPVVTDWVNAGPMVITAASNPTKGSTTYDSVRYRQVGQDYEVEYKLLTTTAGTAGSGEYFISLPSGVQFDSSVPLYTGTLNATSMYSGGSAAIIGNAAGANDAGNDGESYPIAFNSTSFRVWRLDYFVSAQAWSSTYFALTQAQGITITLKFKGQGLSATTTQSFITNDLVPAKAVLGNTSLEIPSITGWQGYTPTFQGFGSPTNIEFEWRQVGENVEIRGKFASGTPTAVEARVGLPAGLTSAGTGVIPSISLVGQLVRSSATSAGTGGMFNILAEPSVNYVTFSIFNPSAGGLTKQNGSIILSSGESVSFFASVPCAGLSATEEVVVSGTQSALVQEEDTSIQLQGANGYGSTATKIRRFLNTQINKGSDILYQDSSTDGASFTVLTSGVYHISYLDQSVGGTSSFLGITKNASAADLTTNISTLASDTGDTTVLAASRRYDASLDVTFLTANCNWSGYLEAGDIIRPHTNGVASVDADITRFTIAHQGSLKQLNVSSDQKITIPTSELRFEGASARGTGTETGIVQFTSLAKLRGDAFTISNSNGTTITMTKAGMLSISANVYVAPTVYTYITRNQAVRTTNPTAAETLSSNGGGSNPISNPAWTGFVNVGDVIRVYATANPTSDPSNMLNLSFQEQEIAVSVTNTLPQFSESDSAIRAVSPVRASTNTNTYNFSSILDNIGNDIIHSGSATLGSTFTAQSSGIYQISFSIQTSVGTTSAFAAISKNCTQFTSNPTGIPTSELLAVDWDSDTAGGAIKVASCSATVYLNAGDIIRAHGGVSDVAIAGNSTFTISKVGKPNVTGVDVTPFVSVPQPDVQEIQSTTLTSTWGSTNTLVPVITINKNTNNGILSVVSSATTGTSFVALKKCTVNAGATFVDNVAAGGHAIIYLNNTAVMWSIISSANNYSSVNASIIMQPGDVLTFQRSNINVDSLATCAITAEALSDQILTAPETFSTDTAALSYASSAAYTLSTLSSAPVGTYITFTYAASTNARAQTSTRPTQTDADMNANGIRIFSKAYNSASDSAGLPSVFAIQIGKGLKGVSKNLYKSTGKAVAGSMDYGTPSTSEERGFTFQDYNEVTGILLLDAGQSQLVAVGTGRTFTFVDQTSQTSGYLVINASKNPALTGFGLGTVAARGVSTSGQSIPNTGDNTILYDAVKTYDTHGALNAATGTFTAPESGYYQASWSCLFSFTANLGQVIATTLYKNGVTFAYGAYNTMDRAVAIDAGSTGSCGVYLSKGDTVQVRVFNNRAGGATSLTANATHNYFSIHKTSIGTGN